MAHLVRFFVCVALVWLWPFTATTAEPSATYIDDLGQHLTIAQPIRRVISLSPMTTENIYTVHAEHTLVGVSSHSDYPEAAKQHPIISDYQSLNLEAILKARPDVIIAWHGGLSPAQSAQLAQLQIPVYYQSIRTLADIPYSLLKLSRLLHTETQSATAIANAYTLIPRYPQPQQPLRAFYQIWHQPLITINRDSWINDALERCGARNLYASLPTLAPTIDPESVITAQPQLIITATRGGIPDHSLDSWRQWSQLPAVQNQAFIYLDDDAISRATLRTLAATQTLCTQIQTHRQTMP